MYAPRPELHQVFSLHHVLMLYFIGAIFYLVLGSRLLASELGHCLLRPVIRFLSVTIPMVI